jgi:hypothetical protein
MWGVGPDRGSSPRWKVVNSMYKTMCKSGNGDVVGYLCIWEYATAGEGYFWYTEMLNVHFIPPTKWCKRGIARERVHLLIFVTSFFVYGGRPFGKYLRQPFLHVLITYRLHIPGVIIYVCLIELLLLIWGFLLHTTSRKMIFPSACFIFYWRF